MSKKRTFTIQKTARYFVHGEDITKAKRVWFVIHGYGQLAQYFIRSFEHLDPKENFILAPEGFHRFYLDGFSGRVGASWMTKEERLDDIDDYIKYLDELRERQTISPNQETILLGFSQGVATSMRWLALGNNSKFDKTILWAGSMPHDLKSEDAKNALDETAVHCVVGNHDPFLTKENIERVKSHLNQLQIEAIWHEYEGDHRIPIEPLNKLIAII